MKLRTEIKPLNHKNLIAHGSPVVFMGSCFSDNIGGRLRAGLFDVMVNPFGTLYNPASIASSLSDIIESRTFGENDIFEYDGRFHSFSHHSSFSGRDRDVVLNRINQGIGFSAQVLRNASVLFVTFGTAYVFTHAESGMVVSNCHKLPADEFIRRCLPVDEIVQLWTWIIERLRQYNEKLRIVFTVSPIRHLADGAHGNQLSKSTLLLAIDRLCRIFSDIIYFPAYEILIDDLRDYRFYASDMTHPSEVAVDYIYELFSKSFFSDETIKLAGECEKLTKRLQHRPMTDDVAAIERFNSETLKIKDTMLSVYPFLEQAVNNILMKQFQ